MSLIVPAAAALSGVALTQWWSARQASARIAAEVAARSWEHRRAVYVEFLRQLHGHHNDISRRRDAGNGETAQERALDPMQQLMSEIELFGRPDTHALAMNALGSLYRRMYLDGRMDVSSINDFVLLARRDLQVPD